ncbi:MAG: 4-hydroxy-tetrahydrodipicolinate reductase [Bacteriovoracaceae bacterium]|nr:4-hydroxy-tetrahydrodipicolinate reductase [Bacteriovoracaceae bacterium]
MQKKIKIGVVGITGRMGMLLGDGIKKSNRYELSAAISRENFSELDRAFQESNIMIDFSSPLILENVLRSSLKCPRPLVICTTGWQETGEIQDLLSQLKKMIPVIVCSNTSIGANLQMYLVKKMAKILPTTFDVDILEKHHRNKVDIPSGTAMQLAKEVQAALGPEVMIGHPPMTHGPRPAGRIEMNSQRSGQLPGDHEVTFTSDLEQISVRHIAYNRELFAAGAIRICDWITNVSPLPGRYSMFDVLGLNEDSK